MCRFAAIAFREIEISTEGRCAPPLPPARTYAMPRDSNIHRPRPQSAREYKMGGLKSVYRRLFRPSSGEAPRAAAVHHAPAAAAVVAPHRLVRAGISTALASAHAKHVPDSTGPHSILPIVLSLVRVRVRVRLADGVSIVRVMISH